MAQYPVGWQNGEQKQRETFPKKKVTYPLTAAMLGPSSRCFTSAPALEVPSARIRSKVSRDSAANACCFARSLCSMRSFCAGRMHVEGRMKGAYITTRGMTSSAMRIIRANGTSLERVSVYVHTKVREHTHFLISSSLVRIKRCSHLVSGGPPCFTRSFISFARFRLVLINLRPL